MADDFLGKWKVHLPSTTGLEEFGAAMGFSEKRLEALRKLDYTMEFTKRGDTYTAFVTTSAKIPAQSYSFKLGETHEYAGSGLFGGTKLILTFTGDQLTISKEGGKIVENYKLEEKRIIMTATTTFKGKSLVQRLYKQ